MSSIEVTKHYNEGLSLSDVSAGSCFDGKSEILDPEAVYFKMPPSSGGEQRAFCVPGNNHKPHVKIFSFAEEKMLKGKLFILDVQVNVQNCMESS